MVIESTAPAEPGLTATSTAVPAAVPWRRAAAARFESPARRPAGLRSSTSAAALKRPWSRRNRPIAVRICLRWGGSNAAGWPRVQSGSSIVTGRPLSSSQLVPPQPSAASTVSASAPGGGRCPWIQRCSPPARSSGRPLISTPAAIDLGPSAMSTTSRSPAALPSTAAVAFAASKPACWSASVALRPTAERNRRRLACGRERRRRSSSATRALASRSGSIVVSPRIVSAASSRRLPIGSAAARPAVALARTSSATILRIDHRPLGPIAAAGMERVPGGDGAADDGAPPEGRWLSTADRKRAGE